MTHWQSVVASVARGAPARVPGARQCGVVLVIALIVLVIATLVALTSATVVRTHFQVVQARESRQMVRFAARAAMELVLSEGLFATAGKVLEGAATDSAGRQSWTYDYTGDGTTDVTVVFDVPDCVSLVPIRNADLDVLGDAEDASCFQPPGEYSLCANAVWEVRARVVDALTGAVTRVRQGVALRAPRHGARTACPD